MDYSLRQIPFTEEALPAVQGFDCGYEEWAQEVANDLKSPDGVAKMVREGAQAWLFVTEQSQLVGFGVLSGRLWRYPNPKKSPKEPISVIPDVGVDKTFQGCPKVEGVEHYSDQILDFLRKRAREHTDRRPILGLLVHPLNEKAIKWYRRVGFFRLDGDWTHPETGKKYWRMALDLGSSPADSTDAAEDRAEPPA